VRTLVVLTESHDLIASHCAGKRESLGQRGLLPNRKARLESVRSLRCGLEPIGEHRVAWRHSDKHLAGSRTAVLP
jgi:hypothetical protein